MILLAIDTASALCAACVYDSSAGKDLGRAVLDLGKGHAEHLMGAVTDALTHSGCDFISLERIAVSVGPGSFTGVRVGVAAARGFAMALKIPVVGVTTLEVLAAEARDSGSATVMTALDGGRGEFHVAIYDEAGILKAGPLATTLEGAVRLARSEAIRVLTGTAARTVRDALGQEIPLISDRATADIDFYACLGAAKAIGEKPKPIYLREADAKPQAGFVLPRIPA